MRLKTVMGLVALLMGVGGSAQALDVGQGEETYQYQSFACGGWSNDAETGEGEAQYVSASVCVDVYEDSGGAPVYTVFAGRGSCTFGDTSGECGNDSVGGRVPASDVVFDADNGIITIATQLRSCTINVAMALPETFSDDASYITPGVETRDSELRVHYQQDEHIAMRRGTASGSVCGWPEASGEGSAFLESVSETDHYLFVDTSLPA